MVGAGVLLSSGLSSDDEDEVDNNHKEEDEEGEGDEEDEESGGSACSTGSSSGSSYGEDMGEAAPSGKLPGVYKQLSRSSGAVLEKRPPKLELEPPARIHSSDTLPHSPVDANSTSINYFIF
jgi:hypothetical protein